MNDLTVKKMTTIKEISDIYRISVDTVTRAVKEKFPERLQQGKITYLSEFETSIIKDYLVDNKRIDLRFKAEVVTEADELLIIAKGYETALRKLEVLQKQAEENKHKVNFYDDVTGSTDTVEMSEAAKVLNKGIGRNKLFELLRGQGVLMNNNQPYQKYVDNGYFRLIEQKFIKPTGETCINIKTVVFQKGMAFIDKLIEKSKLEKVS
ncbi:MAG: hypothetical protein A2015_02220 [Spirochaetes bacterium GWF1_31_7]|nr:MAG: hypothetical protein A2Y30_06070 [Spirochaetes bacterium GWE1_32_154]OHD50731.1 MAG: hypothetical protein A2015_02220 [Spirochaetes bacterium GWF1_31_7]OHD81475.1 MAG: hypothetical protein A2355_11295 [Spirochaetes bacterium RIFOXYB1_FULL_32_8]HBD95068.1 hypothetical protein [Spirochaetia bacterium]HBI38046.1 hypothetical protein [Spirochaetia bacterium]